MLIVRILMSILLLSTGLYAMEEAPQLMGAIDRPGYANLQVKGDNSFGTLKSGSFYMESDLVGTPKVMFAQFQTNAGPEDFEGIADDFIRGNSFLLKNSPTDFKVKSGKLILDKFYFIHLTQTFDNIDIWGSRLNLKATPEGKVFLAGGEIFSDISLNTSPGITNEMAKASATSGIIYNQSTDIVSDGELFVLPLIFDDKIEYRLCYKYDITTNDPLANWQAFVDAHDGAVLWREDMIRYETVSGSVSGFIQPATAYDDQEVGPFVNEYIYADGSIEAITDVNGEFSFDMLENFDFVTLLEGPYMNVDNQIDQDAFMLVNVDPGDEVDVQWDDDNSTIPERNSFYHGQIVHDYVKTLDPGATYMDFPMTCRVYVDGTCNAYYSRQDRSINFFRAGGGCPNTAQIGDVVYHEYGHGLSNIQYFSGGAQDPNGAMHEGFSDVIACFITNQQYVGRGFFGPGSTLRDLDNNNRYPEDWIGESHHDGLIIGGALWHLKQMLDIDRPGYVDTLWHFAKYAYSGNFENYFWDVLTVDDDDGDLDNGTPNAYEIFYCFGELHGIGPGVPIEIDHTPITDIEDSTVAFAIEAAVTSLFTMDDGSVTIYYSTGGEYNEIAMVNVSGDTWSGEIPNQSFGTTVNYYIEAVDHVNLYKYSPEEAPDSVYSFFVGFDVIAPMLSDETGPANTINLFGPYGSFGFQAWDMQGVDQSSAELHYKINDSAEIIVGMPADGDDRFFLESLDVGQTLERGDVISYYYTCLDVALNPNTGRLPITGEFSFEMAASELIDHFENGLDYWTVEGDGWIHFDQQGYQSANCIKTGEMLYPHNANSIIFCNTPFDLTLYENVWLELQAKKYLQENDYVYAVAASSPEGPWSSYGEIGGIANYWYPYTIELEGWAGPGNDEVYVGLQFISDDIGDHYGVLADDITIRIEQATSVSSTDQLPESFVLQQNYPNPFNMNTIIEFALPQSSSVSLDIYDILGRKVTRLIDTDLNSGIHRIRWNGRNENGESVTSGVYFYRLAYNDFSEIKSMTMIK
ncbi:MAG: T9SS type A sorting domain-containing protein [candidate division Zixibacteria bacterium]|nr:T9SS type A sorting domain-containing protein [candidate division Zixibacteria bacterium]